MVQSFAADLRQNWYKGIQVTRMLVGAVLRSQSSLDLAAKVDLLSTQQARTQ